MRMTELMPRQFGRALAPRATDEGDPFLALHRNMTRLLDDFTRGFGVPSGMPAAFAGNWPHVEVSDSADEMKVVAELPGMEEKDVELSLHDGVLTIKGEKRGENQEGSVYSERWHGQFQRSFNVGPDVDPDKVSANFKNGVLTVTMGKRAEAQSQVKRIPISGT